MKTENGKMSNDEQAPTGRINIARGTAPGF